MSGRNIEIKARVNNPGLLFKKALKIADTVPEIIYQKDTFFNCSGGRLKLREFPSGKGELIFYERANTSGPKLSEYIRYETDDPKKLFAALTRSNGTLGRINKKRTLLLIGQTRVHIDEVEDLGHFMELEVVLDEHESVDSGEKIAAELMRKLGISEKDLLETAYIDMIK